MSRARTAAAAILAVHGLIHVTGFVIPWHVASVAGVADRPTALGGALEL